MDPSRRACSHGFSVVDLGDCRVGGRLECQSLVENGAQRRGCFPIDVFVLVTAAHPPDARHRDSPQLVFLNEVGKARGVTAGYERVDAVGADLVDKKRCGLVVAIVLVSFRSFEPNLSAGSPFSYPRWSSNSAFNAASNTVSSIAATALTGRPAIRLRRARCRSIPARPARQDHHLRSSRRPDGRRVLACQHRSLPAGASAPAWSRSLPQDPGRSPRRAPRSPTVTKPYRGWDRNTAEVGRGDRQVRPRAPAPEMIMARLLVMVNTHTG